MLEKEEFKNRINGIAEHIKNNDTANATSDLLKCIDEYNAGFDELEVEKTKNISLTDSNNELQTKINSLKDVNMELLLKVGSPQNNPTSNIPNQNPSGETSPVKRRFEDLFNEKGEIK
jgi:hypothetical protein